MPVSFNVQQVDWEAAARLDATCPRCRKRAKIRKSGDDFFRECEACGVSTIFHTNVPLDTL